MPRYGNPKFSVTVTKKPDGNYRTQSTLPMSMVDKDSALDMAGHASKSMNAMLSFSKSDVRVVFYDIVKKEYLTLTEND